MQLLHALKLGADSKLDKLADAWMNGQMKPGQLKRAIHSVNDRQRAKLDRKLEEDRIKALRKKAVREEVEEVEDDEELLALFQAIEEIQEANREKLDKAA